MSAPEDDTPLEPDEALLVFRAAVERQAENGANVEDLRDPLRQFYAYARRARMSPEQVLIRVKHALDGLSSLDAGDPAKRQALRNRIISMAITTYYSERGRDGR